MAQFFCFFAAIRVKALIKNVSKKQNYGKKEFYVHFHGRILRSARTNAIMSYP